MNDEVLKEIEAIEDDAVRAMIRQVDYLDRKLRRRKALAEAAEAVTHAGLSWDSPGERTLTFYAMRFTGDRPDSVGDVIDPGAPEPWLRRWKADPESEYPNTRGKLPCVWSHQWDSVDAVIGWIGPDDVYIDTKGVLMTAHLFDTPTARRVWETARDMGLGASFAFDVAPGGERTVTRNGKTFNLITEFRTIHEAGPCLIPAEPTAGTHSVKSDLLAQFKALAARIERKFGPGILSETGAGPLVTQGEAPPPVAPVDYVGQRQARCPQCQRWQTFELSRVAASPVAFGISPCCGAILGFGPPIDEKSYRAEVARWKSGHTIVEEVWDPEAERWVRWKALEDTDLDDDDKSSDDRAETLFNLSDRRHTQIAVGIVFGPEDERNGEPLDRWTYRGNEVGADLTEAERARVVERVREAAERFGIDVASGTRKTSPPFRNREAATIGRSMARRDQRAEAKRLQRRAQVELLELEADLARLTAPASPAPEHKAVNVTTYASLEGIGEPIVKGDTL